MIVTVTPNPAVDRTLDVSTLVVGGVNRSLTRYVEPSGKGVNVARALVANGIPAVAVLPSGGREGAQLLGLLDEESVAYSAVAIAEPIRVNISVSTPGGVVTKLNESGPRLSPEEVRSLSTATLEQVGPGDWVVASGALPIGMAPEFYGELGVRVRGAGARFALDTSGAALRRGLAGRPDLVKPNLDEIAELSGRVLPTLGDVVAAAESVRRTTGGAVLVSLGADGAVLVDGGPPVHAEAPVDVVRNAVGAGDNLLAGYLSGCGAQSADSAADTRVAALAEAVAWGSVAVRARGSLGAPVTDADRKSVVVHTHPDLARSLGRV